MGNTTAQGLPWPDPTEPFANTDLFLKQLAEAIDTKLGRVTSGRVNVTAPSVNTLQTVDLALPAGRYTDGAKMSAFVSTNNSNTGVWCTPLSTTSLRVYYRQSTVGAAVIFWLVRQDL